MTQSNTDSSSPLALITSPWNAPSAAGKWCIPCNFVRWLANNKMLEQPGRGSVEAVVRNIAPSRAYL